MIFLSSARDVRHLCACAKCEGLGDERVMIDLIPAMPDKRWHPKCFYDEFGESDVISLRRADWAKFRLCDIPLKLMKRLVDMS
jgi:hypothetical protein